MLLFYLKFQNRLHSPQAQAWGFLFCKNTHFKRLEIEITILLFKKALSWRIERENSGALLSKIKTVQLITDPFVNY